MVRTLVFSDAVERGLRQLGRSRPLFGQGVTGALQPQRPDKMTNGADSGLMTRSERGLRSSVDRSRSWV